MYITYVEKLFSSSKGAFGTDLVQTVHEECKDMML